MDLFPVAQRRFGEKGLILVSGDPPEPSAGSTPFVAPDRVRAKSFADLFRNENIAGIIPSRGGYGAIRLLGALSEELSDIARIPSLTGFSDATNLHAFLWSRFRAVTFHGPHLRGLNDSEWTFEDFWEMLSGQRGKGSPLTLGDTNVVRPGQASGPLVGGNLETLAHLAGTPWLTPSKDSILFLEDIDEPLYAIDRSLWQLKHTGFLEGVKAVILGPFSGRTPRENDPAENVVDLLLPLLPAETPVLVSNRPGHDLPMATWSLGLPVRLDLPRQGPPSMTLLETPF
jgi:muramoyltetrapeptide carboxypeptidase